MSAEIPTIEPASFFAGDTVKWTISLADYPASSGWTLKYALINATHHIAFSSTASANDHAIVLSATTTAAYIKGSYQWQSYIENADASERYTIGHGTIEIKKTFATDKPFDPRSEAQQIFEAIEATIKGRASQGQLSRRVGDRQLQYMSSDELIKWRNFYKNEYEKELGEGGKRAFIKVRFTNE